MELLEFEQGFAARRSGLQLQQGSHARQHRGVQTVGLGQCADRFGETARLTGIDLGARKARRGQHALEGPVIGTGRLEHDAIHRGVGQPFDESPVAAFVVDETPAGAVA